MKIKVRELVKGCFPKVIEQGDWIDLIAAEDVVFSGPDVQSRKIKYIPLGVAMKLPKGFEAHVLPRSSTPKKFNIMCINSESIIDWLYQGNDDEWKFPAKAIKAVTIHKGDRICQFRIQLSQKATVWQKIKWLLSNGIHIEKVDDLGDNNRGGFGSTGVK